jgi:hypothetical protein
LGVDRILEDLKMNSSLRSPKIVVLALLDNKSEGNEAQKLNTEVEQFALQVAEHCREKYTTLFEVTDRRVKKLRKKLSKFVNSL